MSYELFDCEFYEKEIKKETREHRDNMVLVDLYLDPSSRYRYLEKLAHSKTEPNSLLTKRMLNLKNKVPQKHHIYLEKILKELENGGLETR